jgi:hypothetical protein
MSSASTSLAKISSVADLLRARLVGVEREEVTRDGAVFTKTPSLVRGRVLVVLVACVKRQCDVRRDL